VDLLVEFDQPVGYFHLFHLEDYLEDLLHDLEGYWGKQGDSERIRGVEIEKERWNHAADHLCARDPGQGNEKLVSAPKRWVG
jgi:hypothetical protein